MRTMQPHQPLSLLFTLSLSLSLCIRSITTTVASTTPASTAALSADQDFIHRSCNVTLYPDVCYHSLARYARTVHRDPGRLARAAIAVSLSRARHIAEYVSNLSRQADYGTDPRAAAALHDCFTNFGDAVDEMRGSLQQMRDLSSSKAAGSSEESFRFEMSNVQTWMSAALTDEETCTDGFDDVADGSVKTEVYNRVGDVKKVTSNALALVNSYVDGAAP